jgi:hypothetical protein
MFGDSGTLDYWHYSALLLLGTILRAALQSVRQEGDFGQGVSVMPRTTPP